jgi:S-adenosylmethionine-dependent methyltransferase
LYGRVQKVLEDRLYGFGQSLTPKHAFTTTQIEHWLEQRGFEMLTLSGVRIFHDFLTPPVKEKLWSDPASFLELELKYSLNPMYLQMGRYLHFVCVKK